MDWITELKRQVEELEAENERLRAALREIERIAGGAIYGGTLETALNLICGKARAALNGEKQHGHVQSGEDEFGKTGRNEPEKP